jgi:nitrite reductase (NADH) large subunit
VWAAVVRDPERRRQFTAAAQAAGTDQPAFVRERGQRRPVDWPDETPLPPAPAGDGANGVWTAVARAADVPHDGGLTVHHGDLSIAIFHFATRGEWYATQAVCPHRKDAVLGRGLLGTADGEPKVACPLHKKTFSLASGAGLADARYCIRTYPVEVRGAEVWVRLPPADAGRVRVPAAPVATGATAAAAAARPEAP